MGRTRNIANVKGATLATIRKYYQFSVVELCDVMKMTRDYWHKIENKRVSTTQNNLSKFMQTFLMSEDELLALDFALRNETSIGLTYERVLAIFNHKQSVNATKSRLHIS